MPRLIKFRAWNEYQKLMYEVDALQIKPEQNGKPQHQLEGQVMSIHYNPKTVLMQFTGQKSIDKDDVYDGDILKFPGDIEGYYTVEWLEEDGAWGIMFGPADHRIQMGNIGMAHFMQVAGNIYENKELLA